MTIISNGCVAEFVRDLERETRILYRVLKRLGEKGSFTLESLEKVKYVSSIIADKVDIHPLDAKFVMDYLRISNYSSVSIIATLNFFSGRMPSCGVDYAYLHHPLRYKLFKKIAVILKREKLLDTTDTYRLLVRGNSLDYFSVRRIGEDDKFIFWEDEHFTYRIEKGYPKDSLRVGRSFVEGNREDFIVEMSYLRKGVLVFYKTKV